jgi:hypothetical protein
MRRVLAVGALACLLLVTGCADRFDESEPNTTPGVVPTIAVEPTSTLVGAETRGPSS